MDLSRFELLAKRSGIKKIEKLNILLIGLGGVGGYVFESLVRSGVGNITIVDGDVIDATNLNRQLLTNTENIGKLKVNEAKKRALSINPNINVTEISVFLDENNINEIVDKKYDYVIDACDSVPIKVMLIKYCISNDIKIISSMGTANKIDAVKLEVSTLDKTSYCVLAKKIRTFLTKEEMKKTVVVYSKEECIKNNELGSTSYLPAIAGMLITGEIIKNELKN